MGKWIRAVLSGIIGLAIAVVVGAVVNLITHATALAWLLVPICLASLASAVVGFVLGNWRKAKKAPPDTKQPAPPK
jgi:hypothetical protein